MIDANLRLDCSLYWCSASLLVFANERFPILDKELDLVRAKVIFRQYIKKRISLFIRKILLYLWLVLIRVVDITVIADIAGHSPQIPHLHC